jgi:Delta7-sterol 5-desaturase
MPSFLTDFLISIASNFPKNYLTGLVMNTVIIGSVYFVFWKLFAKRLKNWRIQIEQRSDAAQIKRELKNALFTMAVGTLLTCVMLYLSTMGMTKLYTDIADHSIWVALAGFPLLLLIDDMWFYWVHRLLHHPRLFKYVHAEHHKSVDVNPLTSLSFHWLEPLLLTLWIVPVSLLFPIYAPVLGLMQIYGLYDNIKSHLGYELFPSWFNRSPLRMLTSSTYHNLHHTNFRVNYGLHFRIWDRLLGTEYKNYEPTYDAIVHRRRPEEAGA